jgi:hypothetical protein
MQCRVNHVTVNDVPKFLTHFPTENTQAFDHPYFPPLSAGSDFVPAGTQAHSHQMGDRGHCPDQYDSIEPQLGPK